jgi:hypothetical protein
MKDLSIRVVTLYGCQINENVMKDVSGEMKMEDGMVVLYHESFGKHCVFFFCFVGEFEKVPMEEEVGHGGMIINC